MAEAVNGSGNDLFAEVSREDTLSDKVVRAITDAILGGKLQPGERLPSERDLGQLFGVSRTVIREAIRSLAASGLVDPRSGRGSEVSRVDPDAVSRAMNVFLRRSASIDYVAVHEVRAPIEIEIAGYAAKRATSADIEALQDRLEEMKASDGDVGRLAKLDIAFHSGLAAATHNELFVVMHDSISGALLDVRKIAFGNPEMPNHAVRAHEEILRNVAAGDAEGAREAMRKHLREAAGDLSGAPS